MDIRLLGPLEVLADDGTPLPVRGPVLRSVLAALALRVGQSVSSEELIGQVWGARPPARARSQLRGHIRRLREILPADRIAAMPGGESSPPALGAAGPRGRPADEGAAPGRGGRDPAPIGYVLRARIDEIDLGRFRSALRRARQLAADEPQEARRILDAALAQWRGTPLGGLGGDAALSRRERPRLDDLRLLALEEHIDLRMRLGEHHQVLQDVLPLARSHPGRVHLVGQLILALHRCGRTPEAHAALRDASERFGSPGELRLLARELTPDELPMPAGLARRLEELAESADRSARRAAEVFPLLAVADLRSYSAGSVAAMADCAPREAAAALDRLTAASVLQRSRAESYHLGSAERALAARQAAALPPERHRAHLAGLARWYLGSMYRVNAPLALPDHHRARYHQGANNFPQGRLFTSADESMPWADQACEEVLGVAQQLAEPEYDDGEELGGRPLSCFALEAARALEHYFATRQRWRIQRLLNEINLRVAQRRGDVFAEAVALSQLGRVFGIRRESARAIELLDRSVRLFRSIDETREAVHALSAMVPCLGTAGRLKEAVAVAEQALEEAREKRMDELSILIRHNLGRSHLLLGHHDRAHRLLTEGYTLAHLPHSRMVAAGVLAEYHLKTRDYDEAASWADRALAHASEQPFDPYMVAKQRTRLAAALRGLGRDREARVEEMQAQALLEDLNRREQSQLRLLPVGEEPFDTDTAGALL